jgi:hypothetical protein
MFPQLKNAFSIVLLLTSSGILLYFLQEKWRGSITKIDAVMVLALLLISLMAYVLSWSNFKTSGKIILWIKKPFVCFFLLSVLTTIIFFLLPTVVFDDAAIVLRYIDNFGKGYFFKYNATDPSVYGLSGFVHGLFAGLLSYFHLLNSEQSVLFSNYIGFIGTSWFIFRIYQALTGTNRIAFLLWILTLTTTRSFLLVAGSGLETSLHLAFVTGGVYFFLAKQHRAFYFFSALMIISKLDALPIAATLLLYHFILRYKCFTEKDRFRTESLLLFRYFLLPLLAGIALLTFLFGSPLPQSAYAKLFYHSHPGNSVFPFLQNFIANQLKLTTFIIAIILWAVALTEALAKKSTQLFSNTLFGSLCVATFSLYYFYNPGEQMIWYYAMPELFLIMQTLYGIYYLHANWANLSKKYSTVIMFLFLLPFAILSWKDVSEHFMILEQSTQTIERERREIGNDIRALSSSKDTLLSSHGLPTRFFPGYVIDLSGLNSKLATQYHLKADSIINVFKPTFIINHAYPVMAQYLEKHSYTIKGIYRNITKANYHCWVLLKKVENPIQHKIQFLDQHLNRGAFILDNDIVKINEKNGRVILRDTSSATSKTLHIGLDKKYNEQVLMVVKFKNGLPIDSLRLQIGSFKKSYAEIINLSLDISGTDAVSFKINGVTNFIISEPVYELVYQ